MEGKESKEGKEADEKRQLTQQKTYQFYNLDEHPVVGRIGHEFEEYGGQR